LPLRHCGEEVRGVVAGAVDLGADFVGVQVGFGDRREQRVDVVFVGEGRVEPVILEFWGAG